MAFKALIASVQAALAPKISPLEEAVSWAVQKNDIKSLNYWCNKGTFKPLVQLSELLVEAQEFKKQLEERKKAQQEQKPQETKTEPEDDEKTVPDETAEDSSSSSSNSSSSSSSSSSSTEVTEDVSDVALGDTNGSTVPSVGSEGCVDVHSFIVQGLPLSHYSARHDRPLVLKFLVKICGADVSQTDGKGWTPLHYAAAGGGLRTLSELLDLGANPLSRSDQGLLPSQVSNNGHVRYMLSALVSARSAGLHYRLTVTSSAKVDEPIKVNYLCPLQHSEKDHIAICYVGEQPWILNKRMGTDQPIPLGTTSGTLIVSTSQPGPYRIVYIDGLTGVFVAASDICYVFPKPAVAPLFSRRPEPPVVLHPQFRLLTDNAEDFKIPVPPYFNVNFQLNPRAIQIALQVDPALARIRLELVPAHLEDNEFWKNYFYRMVLLDTSSGSTRSVPRLEMKETKSRSGGSSSASSTSSSESSSSQGSPQKSKATTSEKLSSDTSVITEVVYTEL